MKFAITIDRDEDGLWVTSCPSIPGCHSQGNTREESLSNIKEAIELCLEVRAERGGAALRRVRSERFCLTPRNRRLRTWTEAAARRDG
jgi:predicted RNase H-like HicB family nuclease